MNTGLRSCALISLCLLVANLAQALLLLNTHGGLAEQTRAIAPLLPRATLIEVPDLHHGIFDVGAEQLAGLARPFLDAPNQAD
jgi:hypothetical protein